MSDTMRVDFKEAGRMISENWGYPDISDMSKLIQNMGDAAKHTCLLSRISEQLETINDHLEHISRPERRRFRKEQGDKKQERWDEVTPIRDRCVAKLAKYPENKRRYVETVLFDMARDYGLNGTISKLWDLRWLQKNPVPKWLPRLRIGRRAEKTFLDMIGKNK